MAIESTHDHENETAKPPPRNSAQTWQGWSASLLAGAVALAAWKLLVFLWHGAHVARLSYIVCEYFNFCN
jgi:hypothetical protein